MIPLLNLEPTPPQARTFKSRVNGRPIATGTVRLANLRPDQTFKTQGFHGRVVGPGDMGGVVVELHANSGGAGGYSWKPRTRPPRPSTLHEWHPKVQVRPDP